MVRAGIVICYQVAVETQGAAMGTDDVHIVISLMQRCSSKIMGKTVIELMLNQITMELH